MNESPGPPDRPFVGLRPFKTNEALIFFGRQRQIVELLERLHRTRFVGVIGSSGSGKSSLINAGLVPALQAGFLVGDRDRWVIVRMTPGDSPWLRFSDALHAALCKVGLDPTTDLRGTAELAGVSGLLQAMGPCLKQANANLLLFVDQFEEIFRRDEDCASQQREEDADFVSVVLGLAHQREVPVFVVFTMRSDHLGDCDAFLGLPEALNESQYLVPRLSRDEVRLAIEGPIRLFQKEVAPRLVDRLLNDSAAARPAAGAAARAHAHVGAAARERAADDGPRALPGRRHAARRARRHADEALVGMDPALVHTKEAVKAALDALDPGELRFFQVTFQALTDTDHANRKVRRWQSVRELRELGGQTLPQLHQPARALPGRPALLPPLLGRGRIDRSRRDARRHLARELDPAVGPAAGLGGRGGAEPRHVPADPRRRPALGGGHRRPLGGSGPHAGAGLVGQVQAEPALGAALRGRVRGGRQASCARARGDATARLERAERRSRRRRSATSSALATSSCAERCGEPPWRRSCRGRWR